MSLFSPITYYLSPSLLPTMAAELDALLQANGATRAEGVHDAGLTTVIAESSRFEGWEHVGSQVDIVSPLWVERSAVIGKLQAPQHFSTDPAMLFSGITACASQLPSADLEVLSAGITALGGQWRSSLTKEVTHLFALSPDSPKYATAMHYQPDTRIKILLPHWFDDCVKLGVRGLKEDVYEWPDVRVLKGLEGLVLPDNKPKEPETERDRLKRNIYATAALFTPSMGRASPPAEADIALVSGARTNLPAPSNLSTTSALGPISAGGRPSSSTPPLHQVWAGRKILLSRTLQLYHTRWEAVQLGIERAGGVVLRYEGDDEEQEGLPSPGGAEQRMHDKLGRKEKERRRREAELVPQCDALVTRWRFGRAYIDAVRTQKTVGTLAWLFHVQSSGVLSHPLDQLLHYPVPKRPIESFSNHVITVTNYTGEAREYLKKLIMAMGASFTPSMSGANTALIAASTTGTKATKAYAWSIPVVNHTWLEDCFVQWRNLTVAREKYIMFPDGVDFSRVLGERGVFVGGVVGEQQRESPNKIEMEAEELAEGVDELAPADDDDDDEDIDNADGDKMHPPNGTEASMKEVAADLGLAVGERVGADENVDETRMDLDLDLDLEVDKSGGFAFGHDLDVHMDMDDVISPARPEMEVEEQVRKPRSKTTPKSVSPTKPSSKVKPAQNGRLFEEEEEEEEEEEARILVDDSDQEMNKDRHQKERADVISLGDSSDEQVVSPSKSKSKPKQAPPKPKPTPKAKSSPAKATYKVKAKHTPLSEPSSEDEMEVEDVGHTSPRKQGTGRLPSSSVDDDGGEGEMDVDDEELPAATPKTKAKTKAQVNGNGKEQEEKPAKKKPVRRVEPPTPTPPTPPATSPTPEPPHHIEEEEETPPPPPRKKKALIRRVTNEGAVKRFSDNESADEVVVAKPKAKVSSPAKPKAQSSPVKTPQAPPTASASAAGAGPSTTSAGGGLMKKTRGDARTRVRKKRDSVKEAVVVPIESSEDEQEQEQKKVVQTKNKKKATAMKGKKGKKAQEEEEESEVDVIVRAKGRNGKKGRADDSEEEEDESVEEEEAPAKKSTRKGAETPSKPGARTKNSKLATKEKEDKGKGRSKPLHVYSTEDEEEEDDDDTIPPLPESDDSDELPAAPMLLSKSEKRTRDNAKGKEKEKENVGVSVSKVKNKPTPVSASVSAAKGRAKKLRTPTPSDSESAEEEEEPEKKNKKLNLKATTSAAVPKPGQTPLKRVMSVLLPAPEITPEKAKAIKRVKDELNKKAKGKSQGKKTVVVEEPEEEEEEVVKVKSATKKGKAEKAKSGTNAKASASKPPPKSKAVSKRAISTPESEDEDEEEEEEELDVVPQKAKALGRTNSVRAVAGHAPMSPSKAIAASTSISVAMKGKKTVSKNVPATAPVASTSKLSTQPKSKVKEAMPMDVDQPQTSASVAGSTLSATQPRRMAAARANQRLHETIMPDLLQYEAQVKKARKISSIAFAMDGDEISSRDNEGETKKKKRAGDGEGDVDGDKPKKKRRVSAVDPEDADDGEAVVKKTMTAKSKGKQKAAEPQGDDMDVDKPSSGNEISIMTTQVTLGEDVIRALAKLGTKMTTRPSECTHLIASHVVRTEKFLCALASRAPWIVSDKWAIMSAAAKKILPEKDFVLKDKSGESKYGVNLAQSLKRAKELSGKLLAGHTFYVTPRVPVDTKLLKNVVVACGGQVASQTPTARIINSAPDSRHVISCKEDIAIWRPLVAQDIKVYTQELLLNAALKQEVEWDREDYLVMN